MPDGNPVVLLGHTQPFRNISSVSKVSSNITAPWSSRPGWLPTEGVGQRNVPPELWALELRQLLWFLRACRGDPTWDTLLAKKGRVTMVDVNRAFVVPWTRGTGCSVALLMNPEPLRAECMISHTWGEDCDELIEALELFPEKFQVPLSTPVFFCTMSLYQPEDQADGGLGISEQIGMAPFRRVIDVHPSHGMVVVHTTAQDVYTRMWCVHEVDEALEAGVAVRGAMSLRFRERFIGQASEELLDLRTEQATCSCPDDEHMLREAILRKPGSFGRLDEVILAFRREMFSAEAALLQHSWAEDLNEERHGGLVRVVSGSRMLRNCASILRRPAAAAIYEASRPAEAVDCFVSHSQQTAWAPKAWALLYTAVVVPAVVVGLVSDTALHLSSFAGFGDSRVGHLSLRFWFVQLGGGSPVTLSVYLSFGIPCLVLAATMVLAPQIPGLLRRSFFIDKCCVAQDAESQLRAIRQLRPTLGRSRRMILLWQPTYFDSLPCVHELATFLHVHRGDKGSHRVHVVPVSMPLLAAALFMFHVVAGVSLTLLGPHLISSEWHAAWVTANVPCLAKYPYFLAVWFALCFLGLYLAPSFVLWRFAVSYMTQRRRLQEQLSTFSVEKSRCFLEAHRQVLVEDIAAQFGSVAAFESFIRNELPRSISVLRQAPVPLLTALVGAIPHLFFATMMIASAVQDKQHAIVTNMLIGLPLIWLCTDSIALNLVLLLAGRMIAQEGEPASFFKRVLLGPLASASIFSGLTAYSFGLLFPILPAYVAAPLLLGMLVPVVLLYTRSHAPACATPTCTSPVAAERDVECGTGGVEGEEQHDAA